MWILLYYRVCFIVHVKIYYVFTYIFITITKKFDNSQYNNNKNLIFSLIFINIKLWINFYKTRRIFFEKFEKKIIKKLKKKHLPFVATFSLPPFWGTPFWGSPFWGTPFWNSPFCRLPFWITLLGQLLSGVLPFVVSLLGFSLLGSPFWGAPLLRTSHVISKIVG